MVLWWMVNGGGERCEMFGRRLMSNGWWVMSDEWWVMGWWGFGVMRWRLTLRHSMAVPAWCWNAILAMMRVEVGRSASSSLGTVNNPRPASSGRIHPTPNVTNANHRLTVLPTIHAKRSLPIQWPFNSLQLHIPKSNPQLEWAMTFFFLIIKAKLTISFIFWSS